jgi:hypothetical protein
MRVSYHAHVGASRIISGAGNIRGGLADLCLQLACERTLLFAPLLRGFFHSQTPRIWRKLVLVFFAFGCVVAN